jgi:hypothetical protein
MAYKNPGNFQWEASNPRNSVYIYASVSGSKVTFKEREIK